MNCVGLYGGSFNPIHFGHLISARAVAEAVGMSAVVLIPSASPPHKLTEALAAASDRLSMARLAVADDPFFEVSDVELHRQGPSYTIDTVAEMRSRLGAGVELCWIIGADSLPELATWRRAAELVTQVRIVTAARPGWEAPDLSGLRQVVGPEAVAQLLRDCYQTPRIDISATNIRERLAHGQSVRFLLPDAVIAYIEKSGLYCKGRVRTHKT